MQESIGGYFELEGTGNGGTFPQAHGIMLNTGRNAFEYILASIGKVKLVYVPYYTCEVVLEPLRKLDITYSFYHINRNLEIAEDISLQENEYLLYTNYFGIKDAYVRKLASHYKERLIVDCAQALYSEHIGGVNTFYSPRKFVGIPDGGVAYVDGGINPSNYDVDKSEDRMSHLYLRLEKGAQAGYADFRNNAHKLIGLPILNISFKTQELIGLIDFDTIRKRRFKNFKHLHETLVSTNGLGNLLTRSIVDSCSCPMVYPYLTTDCNLKSRLIKEQIFVATYWPNVLNWTKPDMIEYEFTKNLLAIPCDQRYGEEDMNRIIQLICKYQ